MNIQLDTINKTIKLDQNIKFNELFEALNMLFPKGEWQEFTLIAHSIIYQYSNPIYIRPIVDPTPYWYGTLPWIKCLDMNDSINNSRFEVTSGIFNVSMDNT